MRAIEATVRIMGPDEWAPVRATSVAAFGGHSGQGPVIGRLLDALRDSWAWHDDLSFVAEFDGEIVAHVLYTTAIVDGPDRLVDVLLLSPVGVRPEFQGQGIGSQLIRESLAKLNTRPEPLVFLEGSPAYYSRFGFEPAGPFGFAKPSIRIPDPAFMAFKLPSFDSTVSGALVYPDAFWRTDSVGLR